MDNESIKETKKTTKGELMFWRGVAFIIDILVIGIVVPIAVYLVALVLDQFGVGTNWNFDDFRSIVSIVLYLSYFTVVTYKFNTTLGLNILKGKIVFVDEKFLFWKILLREVLFLTIGTGIGFIVFLFMGSYWDRATGAEVKWIDKKEE
ncbi:MAG: RDD family protein [Candidatus Buchananbacteria bacterium]|jgi:hypothetical protein